MKTLLLAATAAATLVGGAAQAHGYGHEGYGALPAPAYAYDSRAFSTYERPHRKGFPLLGVDAGVTVLGLHVGGSAKLRVGLDEELSGHRKVYVPRAAPPAPPPPPAYGGYGRGEEEHGEPCGCDRGSW